ncbi:MAG: prepilin peptidase, partial [Dehalococcoidales bacterium]|nr:prepilin peptidase [Dehalococcoidales bacterium]
MWIAIFGFILGTCVGSFLNVCIDRLPRGQSLIRPSSHCFTCGKKLNGLEMIPIASYLWLKGRCGSCGAAIPKRICAVEIGTGLLFAFILFRYGFSIDSLVLALYMCLFLVLGVIDLEHGFILNKIVYPAIGVSLVLSPFWSSLGSRGAHLVEYTVVSTFLN